MSELLGMEEPRRRFAAMMSGLDIHYDLGEGHPLLGRRMPDLDLVTANGHCGSSLCCAMPAQCSSAPLRARRLRHHSMGRSRSANRRPIRWQMGASGTRHSPGSTAVLVRPDGCALWVGGLTRQRPRRRPDHGFRSACCCAADGFLQPRFIPRSMAAQFASLSASLFLCRSAWLISNPSSCAIFFRAASNSGRSPGLFTWYLPWICFTISSESETTFSRRCRMAHHIVDHRQRPGVLRKVIRLDPQKLRQLSHHLAIGVKHQRAEARRTGVPPRTSVAVRKDPSGTAGRGNRRRRKEAGRGGSDWHANSILPGSEKWKIPHPLTFFATTLSIRSGIRT